VTKDDGAKDAARGVARRRVAFARPFSIAFFEASFIF
jgi:hypothetical protein